MSDRGYYNVRKVTTDGLRNSMLYRSLLRRFQRGALLRAAVFLVYIESLANNLTNCVQTASTGRQPLLAILVTQAANARLSPKPRAEKVHRCARLSISQSKGEYARLKQTKSSLWGHKKDETSTFIDSYLKNGNKIQAHY